jgi:hypothetical protein
MILGCNMRKSLRLALLCTVLMSFADHTMSQLPGSPYSGLPTAVIIGGDRIIVDTDGVAGETVSLTGIVSYTQGYIESRQWLLDGHITVSEILIYPRLCNITGCNFITPVIPPKGSAESRSDFTFQLVDGTTVVGFQAADNQSNNISTSVTYLVQSPTVYLPRIGSLSSQQTPRDTEFSISIRNADNRMVTSAPPSQPLSLNGYIFPQATDRNFMADIFVVASTPIGWFMRNLDGQFIPWNGTIADMVPAYENQYLKEQTPLPIYSGKLQWQGSYGLYLGYMRTDQTELIYTSQPATVEISAP